MKVNLKANDLEGYREELFDFVESRQTKSDATRNAFVYERKRQKKTRQMAQTQELVGENPGLFSV